MAEGDSSGGSVIESTETSAGTTGAGGNTDTGNSNTGGATPGTGDTVGDSSADNSSGDSGFPADAGQTGSGGQSGNDAVAAGVTVDEAVGHLDEQLNASLAVFDGMILTERTAAQTLGAGATGAEAGNEGDTGADEDIAGSGGPLFEEGDLSAAGDEEATVPAMPGGSAAEGDPSEGEAVASSGGIKGKSSGGGTVPPDLVDASDDDIVARQIREAAMKETDPVLREKLWDEYRKYKRGN